MSPLQLMRQSEVLEVLSSIDDPSLVDMEEGDAPSDLVSLNLVRNVEVNDDTTAILVEVLLPIAATSAGARDRLNEKIAPALREELDWCVGDVDITFVKPEAATPPTEIPSEMSALESLAATDGDAAGASDGAAGSASSTSGVPGVGSVGHIIAVASCKGGVGKSTTAVNLAYAMAARGKRVGLVDLDIHGPSLPTMVTPDAPLELNGESLLPLSSAGVKLMSMGFINPGVMPIRGAKVTPIVQQLVGRTEWGELDFLFVDMPPGTGDVQLTLSQDFRVAAAVLVTTPQRLSFVDVVKGVEMFDKVGIPTIAVMENMSGMRLTKLQEEAEALIAKHGLDGELAAELRAMHAEPQPIFGESHVRRLKDMWGIAASYSLPLLSQVAASADGGVPLVVSDPNSEAARVYAELAAAVESEVRELNTRTLPALMYLADRQKVYIALPDGSQQQISPIDLRRNCRSPTNDMDSVPDDLHPLDIVPMGNYAISVRWSDGHQSLIPYRSFIAGYPYEQ